MFYGWDDEFVGILLAVVFFVLLDDVSYGWVDVSFELDDVSFE